MLTTKLGRGAICQGQSYYSGQPIVPDKDDQCRRGSVDRPVGRTGCIVEFVALDLDSMLTGGQ